MRRISSVRGRRRDRNVVMPPTLRYRSASSSQSRSSKRKSSRLRMRPWLEGLLDREECCILRWENKMFRTFSIAWRHASSRGFDQSQHGDLFYMWAQHTGKLHKQTHGDHSTNKSTFRCALHSLKDCIELTKKGDKRGEGAKRTYQFIDPDHHLYDKKRKTASLKRKKAQPVDEKDDYTLETKDSTTDGLGYLSTETNSPAANLRPVSPDAVHNIQRTTTPCNDIVNIKDDSSGASTPSPLTPISQHMDNLYINDEITEPEYFQSPLQSLVPVEADNSQLYSETETSAGILITLQCMNYENDCASSDFKQEPITQDIYYNDNQYQDVKTIEHHDTGEAAKSIFLPKLNCGGKVKIQQYEQDDQPDMIDCSFIQALLDQHQQTHPQMDNECSEIASDVIIENEELPVEYETTERNFLTLKQGKRVRTEVQPVLFDQSLAAMEVESSFDSLNSSQYHDIFSIGTF